jgi:hypothetical protein
MPFYKLTPLIFVSICLISYSCDPSKKAADNIVKPKPLTMDKEWTLEAAPNGLDNVGVIFAIDSTGAVVRIPGGALDLITTTEPVAVTQQTKTKNVSAGALINFLAIKYIDSTANLSLLDTSHLNATFSINNGSMTVIGNDNIKQKFSAQSSNIISNIKTFGLEKAKLYLILETIKSPNVTITFDKSSQKSASLAAKIKSMIGVDTHAKIDVTNNSDLVYTSNVPLTVFYKLRYIDVNVIGDKGTGNEKVDVALGNVVKNDELPVGIK